MKWSDSTSMHIVHQEILYGNLGCLVYQTLVRQLLDLLDLFLWPCECIQINTHYFHVVLGPAGHSPWYKIYGGLVCDYKDMSGEHIIFQECN